MGVAIVVVINLIAIVFCGISALTHDNKKVRLGFLLLVLLNFALLFGNLGLYEIPTISIKIGD